VDLVYKKSCEYFSMILTVILWGGESYAYIPLNFGEDPISKCLEKCSASFDLVLSQQLHKEDFCKYNIWFLEIFFNN